MKMFKILALSMAFSGSLAIAYIYDDMGLDSRQRYALINRIIDDLTSETQVLENQLKKSGKSKDLQAKMVKLRTKIAEEKKGVTSGQIYLAETSQREKYSDGLDKRLKAVEDLLKEVK
jgi:hypothetical protein